MAKLLDSPINQKDIEEYLLEAQDGFQLELQAYKVCKENGFRASHGGTYEDPVTKKTREYDVRAIKIRDRRKIQLAIECKGLKSFFPLLVLQTPRTAHESYHETVFSYESSVLLEASARNERFRRLYSFYKENDFVGKSTVQVGRSPTKTLVSNDSDVFEKWSQAFSSAHDLIANSVNDSTHHKQPFFFTITLPILLIPDGTLWTANYNEDGLRQNVPQEAKETTIFVGKEYWTGPMGISYAISHLHIFTMSSFISFAKRLSQDWSGDFWEEFFPSDKLSELCNK